MTVAHDNRNVGRTFLSQQLEQRWHSDATRHSVDLVDFGECKEKHHTVSRNGRDAGSEEYCSVLFSDHAHDVGCATYGCSPHRVSLPSRKKDAYTHFEKSVGSIVMVAMPHELPMVGVKNKPGTDTDHTYYGRR